MIAYEYNKEFSTMLGLNTVFVFSGGVDKFPFGETGIHLKEEDNTVYVDEFYLLYLDYPQMVKLICYVLASSLGPDRQREFFCPEGFKIYNTYLFR